MSTYLELKAQAEKLFQQAETVRQQEIAEVISEIKAKMVEYSISIDDLSGGRKSSKKSGGSKPQGEVRFRGPQGETWSGKGRQPQWMKSALLEGKSKDDFAA